MSSTARCRQLPFEGGEFGRRCDHAAMLERWFRRRLSQSTAPRIAGGLAVYAIGDIRGRLDLLTALFGQIATDAERHPADLLRPANLAVLRSAGLEIADDDRRVPPPSSGRPRGRRRREATSISCALGHAEGDYVFVHAEVRPGRSLEQQDRTGPVTPDEFLEISRRSARQGRRSWPYDLRRVPGFGAPDRRRYRGLRQRPTDLPGAPKHGSSLLDDRPRRLAPRSPAAYFHQCSLQTEKVA